MDSEIIIYQTEDDQTKIETRYDNETVWLTQEQIGFAVSARSVCNITPY